MVVSFFVFIFGTIVGSFLNVVILRYNSGESIIKNSSKCFSCRERLKWYEMIPVLSFIFQRGRCRHCKSKISWQYPIVELLTGLVFLLIFLKFQFTLVTSYYFVVFSILIIISVYDLRHQIIPNLLVYIFDILAFLNLLLITNYELRITNFLAGLCFFAFFALIWLLSKGRAMGFGDAKLALGIGWFLGLNKGIFALLLSFWLGAIVGIFLLIFFNKKYNIKSSIPFGPFLAMGAAVAFLWTKNFF